MKILFLGFREAGSLARQRDEEGLLQAGRLQPAQLKVVHAFDGALPASLLDDVQAVILGGSNHSTIVDFPNAAAIEALVAEAADRGLPLLGLCFGHQLIAKVLGGTVIHDLAGKERGTYAITLTPDAAADPLFRVMPPSFLAQCSHQDRVAVPPPGSVVLASSALCPVHAYALPGRRIYGVQFHPELTREHLDASLREHGGHDAARAALRDTPEAASLVAKFVAMALSAADH
jgi:GMP synthase (glutamine-hydrolysing)